MADASSNANSSKIITRCPQCKTAFRVTNAQLSAAKGAVRCGSCLTVFKAYDYVASAPPPKATREKTYEDDNIISDGLNLDDKTYSENNQRTTHSLFERQPKKEQRHNDAADESWAVDLLAELEDDDDIKPIIVKRKKNEQQAAKPSGAAVKSASDTASLAYNDAGAANGGNTSTSTHEVSKTTSDTVAATDEHPMDDAQIDHKPSTTKKTAGQSEHNNISAISAQSSVTSTDELLDTIESQPVDMSWQPVKSSSIRWTWVLASLLGILLILLQIALFKFDTLSRQTPYRSWYSAACSVFNCSLPPLVDVSKIEATRLVVRKHPTTEDALTVDVILLNKAAFEQPYPEIILTFTNLKDAVVAQRVFTSSEYLAGDLKGNTIMPKKQPVQLAIEIVDPGPEAENYRISIR